MIFVRKCFCCTREVYWLGWRSKVARLHLLKSEICNAYIVQRQFSNLTVISGGSRISLRRGRQLPRGGANIRFCQIFPKTAWNWKNLDPRGGGARPKFYYVDPPLVMNTLLLCTLVVLVAMEEEQTPVVTRQRNGHRIHAVILRLTGRQWFSAHLWLVQLMST